MRPAHPAVAPGGWPSSRTAAPGRCPRHPCGAGPLPENRGHRPGLPACPPAAPAPSPHPIPTALSENRIPARPGVFVRNLHLPPGMDRRPGLRHAPGPNPTRSGHTMPTRQGAIARAAAFFDDGSYKALLTRLVEIPSTAQEPGLRGGTAPLPRPGHPPLGRIAWASPPTIHPNPLDGFGPIMTAARIEDPALPTVLLYGHGDTVRGLDDQWRPGLLPWTLTEEGDRWYGRGTADNKGQHAINLAALEAVIAERGGRLGFNVKLLLEMAEERGSARPAGIRADLHEDTLAADVLIASDGPRVEPGVPTIATGNRGIFQFDLVLKLREGGVHSGHWGGLTTDPAIRLTHALSQHHGPARQDPGARLAAAQRRAGRGARGAGRLPGRRRRWRGPATIDPDWGEPGLTPAEKIYGWNGFIVLAMLSAASRRTR